MTDQDRKKMCPFCEGTVDIDAVTCVYCGSSLLMNCNESITGGEEPEGPSFSAQYQPPNSRPNYGYIDPTSDIPGYSEESETPKKATRKRAAKKESSSDQHYISSVFLLSLGANLFALSWFIFFFSDQGHLTLEWKTKHWFLYFLCAVPCLYAGWKKLRELQ